MSFSYSQADSAADTQKELDVLIVGGGISGLCTAWWLAQYGLRVQVWEKSARAGGKIKTNMHNGFQTEQAASMIMNFKAEVDEFFSQSGLEAQKAQRLLKAQSSRYLIHQGKIHPLPMTIAGLFFSPMWSTSGKFRLLMEPFISKALHDNETVSEFVIRRFGQEFLEKAMEPFIAGTLASDPDLACAQHVIPRLTALEKRFGSITAGIFAHKITGKRTARNPQSFSFKAGMETLPQHLANDPNIGFHANINVQKLIHHKQHKKDYWEVFASSPDGDRHCTAHHVILCSPAHSAAQLLKPLNTQLSELLTSIQYAPLSVVHLGLERSAIKHPLDSVGFLVPRQEQSNGKLTINGNLWMSSIFSGRAPDNSVLLSSYLGGARHPDAIKLSSQESIDQVMHDISSLLGIKNCTTPLIGHVDKHHKALPMYHGNYHQILQLIEQELLSLPGLHLEANYKGGVSVRDRIVSAKQTAAKIFNMMPRQSKQQQHNDFYPFFVDKTVIERPA